MQINQEVFMLVAEEMSISRAAEKACVTQQCVSDHIKRLEQFHKVKLFTRRPRFQLTDAGETMLRTLRNMQAMERNMNDDLKRLAEGTMGRFTLGIGTSRARAMLPLVLSDYSHIFPDIEINFVLDDTVVLAEKLKQGKIDLFVGVNANHDEDFLFTPLCDDEICLIISNDLLKRSFGQKYHEMLKGKIDLNQFCHVPFSYHFSTSTVSHMVNSFLDENHITLKIPYRISDTETQISMCAAGLCAALCPHMLLSSVKSHNLHCQSEKFIHELSIKEFNSFLRIEMVSLKSANMPRYISEFIEILKNDAPKMSSTSQY